MDLVAFEMFPNSICPGNQIEDVRLSLETGSWPYFEAARAFYRRHGFVECPPFGDYNPDPNSVFMTLELEARD